MSRAWLSWLSCSSALTACGLLLVAGCGRNETTTGSMPMPDAQRVVSGDHAEAPDQHAGPFAATSHQGNNAEPGQIIPYPVDPAPEQAQERPAGTFSQKNQDLFRAIAQGSPLVLTVDGSPRRYAFRPANIGAEGFAISVGPDQQADMRYEVYEGVALGPQGHAHTGASLALVNDALAMTFSDSTGKYLLSADDKTGVLYAQRLIGTDSGHHECQIKGDNSVIHVHEDGEQPRFLATLSPETLDESDEPLIEDAWVDHPHFRYGPEYDASLVDIPTLWVSAKSETGSSSNLSSRAATYFTYFARHKDTYERQLGLRPLLTELIMIPDDSSDDDPGPTGGSSDLGGFRTWLNNHRPASTYKWGHAACWMIVDGGGGGVIGRAYVDAYGNSNYGLSVNERRYDWDVYNHELGHNVGASHTEGGVMNSRSSNNNEDFFKKTTAGSGDYSGAMDIYNYMGSSFTARQDMYGTSPLRHPEEIPFGVDDNASTAVDTQVTIPVLGNDQTNVLFGAVNTLSLVEVGSVYPPSAGAAIVAGNEIQFTPTSGYTGQAWFSYTLRGNVGNGGDGWLHEADVIVTVGGDNTAPGLNPTMQLNDDYVVSDFSSNTRINPLLNDVAAGRLYAGDVDAITSLAGGATAQSYSDQAFHLTGATVIQGNGGVTLETRHATDDGTASSGYSGYVVYAPGAGDTGQVIIEYSAEDANNQRGTARIYIGAGGPADIVTQPVGADLVGGDTYELTVNATGIPAPTYQWYLNGSPIDGANWRIYRITDAGSADAGTYTVVVTNSEGTDTSDPAVITVNDRPAIAVVWPTDDTARIPEAVGIVLDTTVTDDGYGGSSISTTWSKLSGPGLVAFDSTTEADSGATFSANGEYVLRLAASDGTSTTTKDITVVVGAESTGGLPAPVSPALYYNLDDGSGSTATDSIGTNDATLVNGPAWGTGVRSGALTFDGTDDHLLSGSGLALDDTAGMSASAWVKWGGGSGTAVILAQQDGSGTGRTLLSILDGGEIYTYAGGNGSTGSVVPSGRWTHVAVTAGSGSVTLYLDGQEVATANRAFEANDGPLVVGAHKTIKDYFDGDLDDVAVYTRVLTAEEVATLAGVTDSTDGPSDSLIGHWMLNESTGTTAADESGNGRDGTTDGTTWTSGRWGGSAAFDGSNDFIDFGDIDAIDGATAWSCSLWVQVNALGKDHAILSKSSFAGTADSFLLWRDNSAFISGRTKTLTMAIGDSSGGAIRLEGASNALNDTGWHHIVVTFEAGSSSGLRMFIDGIEDPNSPVDMSSVSALPVSSDPLRFGTSADASSGKWLDGRLDDVRLYSRVLTTEEIQSLGESAPSNVAPFVEAGGPYAGDPNVAVALDATVTDGEGDALTTAWLPVAGVSFADSTSVDTNATGSGNVSHTLRLTAHDGSIMTFDDAVFSTVGVFSRVISAGVVPGYGWNMSPGPGTEPKLSGDGTQEVFDSVPSNTDQTLSPSPTGGG